MDCSLPGSSVLGIFQARILEWIASSFSRGSFWLRDRTCISCIGRQILYHWATKETHPIDKSAQMNAMIRISNIAKDIKWKAKYLAPHPPFPEQSGSLFVSGKRLYILVNHGRESTAVLLIGEITTHVVGSNRWNRQVVPPVDGKQLSLHIPIRRPGIWALHCWSFVQFASFSSPSKSMVELHFPTYLKWDENIWLVSITKTWVEGISCRSSG